MPLLLRAGPWLFLTQPCSELGYEEPPKAQWEPLPLESPNLEFPTHAACRGAAAAPKPPLPQPFVCSTSEKTTKFAKSYPLNLQISISL